MPLSQEQAERVWLDSIGAPSRYGYAYGMPQRTFHEYHSELEDLGSSYDDGSRKTNLALEQKIVELSSQVEVVRARKNWRDIEYAGLKAQFDALLASEGFPLVLVMSLALLNLNLFNIPYMINKEIR